MSDCVKSLCITFLVTASSTNNHQILNEYVETHAVSPLNDVDAELAAQLQ